MHAFRLTVASVLLLALGACASDDEFVPLDTSSKDPSATATAEPEPEPEQPQNSNKKLIRDLAAYAEQNNTSLGKVVIDSIDPSPGGFDVLLNPKMAEFGLKQAQVLIAQWNRDIVGMLATAGRGSGQANMRYYLGGQLVAQNKVATDAWAIKFVGILTQ